MLVIRLHFNNVSLAVLIILHILNLVLKYGVRNCEEYVIYMRTYVLMQIVHNGTCSCGENLLPGSELGDDDILILW